jgi:hypothetical protein
MLALVLVASLGLGWFAPAVQTARRRGRAVEALRACGAQVVYEHQWDGPWRFLTSDPPRGPARLRSWLGFDFFNDVVGVFYKSAAEPKTWPLIEFPKLEFVSLTGERVTDQHLQPLNEVKSLRVLLLNGASITDAGLWHLRNLRGLRELHLSGCHITDEGLVNLADLDNLEVLDLDGARIRGWGFSRLSCRRTLRELSLAGTLVNNQGLPHIAKFSALEDLRITEGLLTGPGLAPLRQLTQLNRLYLQNCGHLTEEDVQNLEADLPNLGVDEF